MQCYNHKGNFLQSQHLIANYLSDIEMYHHLTVALILLLTAITTAVPISESDVVPDHSPTTPPTNNATKASTNDDESVPTKHTWPPMEDPNLFEGDIKISQEMIDKYYGKKNDTKVNRNSVATTSCITYYVSDLATLIYLIQNRPTRSAMRGKDLLWPNKRVYYQYHSTVSSALQTNITTAMDAIERQTCLRFIQRASQSDYVEFTSNALDGCTSNIGKIGGRQEITLGPKCNNVGIIIHEIGHALGLWHEQSRPDRDSYVRILYSNIISNETDNFDKRNSFQVDYQGTAYDYASVMHYRENEFALEHLPRDTVTIEITNYTRYNEQGTPTLGAPNKTQLSDNDAIQLKRMYNCPGSGNPGILKVYIRNGVGLPDTDGWFTGNPDPYVKVTAVGDNGGSVTYNTRHIQGDRSPTWNQWMDFGGRISWQYFDMSVWDADVGSDDLMLTTQSFSVNPGYHRNLVHCDTASCSARVYFDYNLIPDGNECSPNPCVRGTCIDLISAYRCNCPTGYRGTRCEFIRERLRVYVRYGRNLPDRDGWFAGDSDPYVRVIAYDHSGNYRNLRTADDHGNENPQWNQWLEFGVDTWTRFTVQVFDEDVGSDDALSSSTTYNLNYLTSRSYVRMSCVTGYIYFDYTFIRDRNDCSPNPCVRGTCTDLFNAFRCNCPSGYTGTTCDTISGRLRIYARYGSGLPDRDGWLAGDSDPYVRVIAYDHDGNSKSLRTADDHGDESPEWYQYLDFGVDTWIRFTVQVFDEDVGRDDSLSSTTSYFLYSHITRTNVRKTCDSGYIYFNYYFQP